MHDFAPEIVAFVCNWCSYGAADKAGGLRLECPPEVKLVRVMCSGRVDPELIVDAFRTGADGVLVLGCHPGDCHYREGNYKARQRVGMLTSMLPQLGIDARRLRLDWVAAGEAARFQQVVGEMTETVRALGPLQFRGAVTEEATP